MKNKEELEIIKMALQYYYQSIYNGYTGNTKECRDANNHLLEKIKDTAKYIEKINEYEDLEEYLEIDLVVFFRCMAIVYEGEKKDDCFIKGENKLTYGHLIDLDYCKKKVVIRDNNDNEYVYGFDSYGKCWELI